MRITVEFIGFPDMVQAVGQKRAELDVKAVSVKHLIDELIHRYGEQARKSFYGRDGCDPNVHIVLNREKYISLDQHETAINEGDLVTFMLVVAGG